MDRTIIEKHNLPPPLLETPQPPDRLWVEGTMPDFSKTKALAVVGSRRFTPYGKQVCEKIIAELAGYDITIVSGLALGIDTIAHKAALQAGLKTIALPGSGLDRRVLYPKANARLADEILASGGALISEFEPDFPAHPWSFPRRNRIMAGVSRGVLVIEAAERSGTLITARLALEYNRDVYVIPNGIFSLGSKGSNKLLRQGAHPITSGHDLLEIFDLMDPETPSQEKLFLDCTPQEVKLLNTLCDPLSRDEVIRLNSLLPHETIALLSTLEIKGYISEKMGKIWRNI